MTINKDTIFALSTATGKAALAVIRISGTQAHKCLSEISLNMPKQPNVATLNKIKNKEGLVIDHSITTLFKKPKSFTGEDMVEISVHGGGAVIKEIYNTLLSFKNIRIGKPGEFTRRAFENNKLDLTQVEAIADIVNAETELQRQQALSNLSGNFFISSKEIFEDLKKILANIEAFIDFADEELPQNLMNKILEQIENNIKTINKMLEKSSGSALIRTGFVVTILGKPNTGKSSFINNISDRNIAIVTSQPGTTTDIIESFVDIGGFPVRFLDTAGIRKSKNSVEKIGIKKALVASKESNINLIFIEKFEDIKEFRDIKNPIFVKSKQDISKKSFISDGFYNISSKNNYGVEDLLEIIRKKISDEVPPESLYISRERHIDCLEATRKSLISSKKAKTIDLIAEDIRQAIKSLNSLFGNVDIEDILDIIFSDFCIGK